MVPSLASNPHGRAGSVIGNTYELLKYTENLSQKHNSSILIFQFRAASLSIFISPKAVFF